MSGTTTPGVAELALDTETQRLVQVCTVDGRRCEVEDALLPGLSRLGTDEVEQALRRARISLPCGMCRRGERDALNIRHLRLGRTERRILVGASTPSAERGTRLYDCWTPAEWQAGARALAASATRASKRLVDAGLVQRLRIRDHLFFGRKRQCLWRTALGELVIQHVGDVLANGGRIRWGDLPESLARQVRLPLRDLVVSFSDDAEQYLRFQRDTSGLLRDPASVRRAEEDAAVWRLLREAAQAMLVAADQIAPQDGSDE